MTYRLSVGVASLLNARGFPIPVTYGRERVERGSPSLRIVVERDRENSDAILPVQGMRRNPPKVAVRMLASKATIWAKSELRGATQGEHEDLCEQIVDAVIAAVDDWIGSNHNVKPTFTEARYESPEAAGAPEGTWPGVVYVLRWAIPHEVTTRDYVGAGLPEGTVAATTTTQIRITRNASLGPPETIP